MTANQNAWNKEIRRIKRFIREAGKRGFVFDVGNIIPETPNRITKNMITELKRKTTPEMLYRKSYFILPTGEAISGTERRKQERRIASQKGQINRIERLTGGTTTGRARLDMIYKTIEDLNIEYQYIPYFGDLKIQHLLSLKNLLDNSVYVYGEKSVTDNIVSRWQEMSGYLEVVYQESDQNDVNLALTEIAGILKGSPLTNEESEQWEAFQYYNFS